MDVGFGNIYALFETPENVGFGTLTARGLLAVAYAAGEHEQMLLSGPESFLATWESRAEARSIRPAETGAAADASDQGDSDDEENRRRDEGPAAFDDPLPTVPLRLERERRFRQLNIPQTIYHAQYREFRRITLALMP